MKYCTKYEESWTVTIWRHHHVHFCVLFLDNLPLLKLLLFTIFLYPSSLIYFTLTFIYDFVSFQKESTTGLPHDESNCSRSSFMNIEQQQQSRTIGSIHSRVNTRPRNTAHNLFFNITQNNLLLLSTLSFAPSLSSLLCKQLLL